MTFAWPLECAAVEIVQTRLFVYYKHRLMPVRVSASLFRLFVVGFRRGFDVSESEDEQHVVEQSATSGITLNRDGYVPVRTVSHG
jgi:hypothetical protein